MSSVLAVAFVVSCGPQLLSCSDINTDHMVFDDIGKCQRILERVVREQQQRVGPTRKVMGRCHYTIELRNTGSGTACCEPPDDLSKSVIGPNDDGGKPLWLRSNDAQG